jgi:hypothetical protein
VKQRNELAESETDGEFLDETSDFIFLFFMKFVDVPFRISNLILINSVLEIQFTVSKYRIWLGVNANTYSTGDGVPK